MEDKNMCNRNSMFFFNPLKGTKSSSDIKITAASKNGKDPDAIRISLSIYALKQIGSNIERLAVGIHPDYRNRIYLFDAREIPNSEGYKLIESGKKGDGSTRKYIRIDSRSLPDFKVMKTIGEYHLCRDENNDCYIALKERI